MDFSTMTIQEILRLMPEAEEIFAAHGMGCPCCLGAEDETLSDGASGHGINLAQLLKELAELWQNRGAL